MFGSLKDCVVGEQMFCHTVSGSAGLHYILMLQGDWWLGYAQRTWETTSAGENVSTLEWSSPAKCNYTCKPNGWVTSWLLNSCLTVPHLQPWVIFQRQCCVYMLYLHMYGSLMSEAEEDLCVLENRRFATHYFQYVTQNM